MPTKDTFIFSLPNCERCEQLKKWMKEKGLYFYERKFGTRRQVDAIMQNIFNDPPLLMMKGHIFSPFNFDGEFQERELIDFINEHYIKPYSNPYKTHRYCPSCGRWVLKEGGLGQRCRICGRKLRPQALANRPGRGKYAERREVPVGVFDETRFDECVLSDE